MKFTIVEEFLFFLEWYSTRVSEKSGGGRRSSHHLSLYSFPVG
jgi:hypothetical protein